MISRLNDDFAEDAVAIPLRLCPWFFVSLVTLVTLHRRVQKTVAFLLTIRAGFHGGGK